MADLPDTPEARRILAAIGGIVVQWTGIQGFVRAIISNYTGGWLSFKLIDDDEGMSLINCLRQLTAERAEDCDKPHLVYLCDFLQIVCDYRNYYVHGIIAITDDNPSRQYAAFLDKAGRNNSNIAYREFIDVACLEALLAAMNSLDVFIRGLNLHFAARGRHSSISVPPVPGRPPFPEKLVRQRWVVERAAPSLAHDHRHWSRP